MSRSEIEQTAKRISLSVYSETPETEDMDPNMVTKDMLKRTGIDVEEGTITLEADKTNVIGSLNVYSNNAGFNVWNTDGTMATQMRNDTLPVLRNYVGTGGKSLYSNITGSKPATNTGGTFTVTYRMDVGSCPGGVEINIRNMRVDVWTSYHSHGRFGSSGIYTYGTDKTITRADVIARLKSGSTVKKSVTCNNLSGPDSVTRTEGFSFIWLNQDIVYKPTYQENLTLEIEAKYYTRDGANAAANYYAAAIADAYVSMQNVNAIYLNGMRMGSTNYGKTNEFLWWGPYKFDNRTDSDYAFEVRNRRQNLRITTFGIQRTLTDEYGGIVHASEDAQWINNGKFAGHFNNVNENYGEHTWCDVGSCTPVYLTSSDLDLDTANEQGVPIILTKGIICTTNSSGWRNINLPPPDKVPGKKIIFKALEGGAIRLKCTGYHNPVNCFVHSSSAGKQQEMEIGDTTAMFFSTGKYWVNLYGA